MSIAVFGAGVGRTGTLSLKLALEHLGFGPCHHMEDVLRDLPLHVPLWRQASSGKTDWDAAYWGFKSAVDWPTASFWRELAARDPAAKFILTTRSTESWVQSFSETIQKLMAGRANAPPPMQPFLDMAEAVLGKAGFTATQDAAALAKAFEAHNGAVKAGLGPERLLVYQVKEGWAPLCAFLKKPVPDEPFPRSNDRADFWERIRGSGP
jgi:Sulfotransferase domain